VTIVLPILLQVAAADAPASQPRVLRLNEAVDTALKAQPSLAQAKAQTAAAEGRATQARQLYYPQITATASYSRVRSASVGGGRGGAVIPGSGSTGGTAGGTTGTTPTAFATSTSNSAGIDIFTFGGNATQLIWDFGSVRHRAHAADKLVESFQANEHASTRAVVVDVRRAYFTARAQKALIVVAKQSLENFQAHLTQIEGFVKVGTRPEIDLAQAKTDVANARLSLINSTNAYAIAKANLGRAMGVPGSPDFDVSDDELSPVDNEEGSVDQLVEKANKARPDVVVYQKQRESYELQVKGYKAQYLPTLSASAGASETGTALGDLGPAWNVGVAVNWPVFQGWVTHGLVREAEANADVARAQGETVKLQVRVDIQQAQLGIRAAKESQKAAAEAEANAKERLRLAEGRYTAGVGSVIELGDAQLALATASAQVIQANFNLSSARADLLAAMGER
jgi:outer membrane protein